MACIQEKTGGRDELMKIKEGCIVKLKDGRTGKVLGQLFNREYILQSGKGGQISYFEQRDIEKIKWSDSLWSDFKDNDKFIRLKIALVLIGMIIVLILERR